MDAKNAKLAADDLQDILSKEIELFFKISECQKELAEISQIKKPALERHFTEKVCFNVNFLLLEDWRESLLTKRPVSLQSSV